MKIILISVFCLVGLVQAGFSPLASCVDDPSCNKLRPDYELINLRPADFRPNVSGLAWHPDGRLIVQEWSAGGVKHVEVRQFNGNIYLVDGVQDAQGPDDVDWIVWKDELEIPTGIVVLGDTIYVASGFTLDGWIDSDGDDQADAVHRVFDWGYENKCRHEFFFGLVYQDPYFYATASRCKDEPTRPAGVNSNTWQMHTGRGANYKIHRYTGDAELIAGGFREPAGMGVGPENGVYECDNQGSWLPGSKLVHIQKDRFYGYHADNYNPEEDYGIAFRDVTETPATVWMPHSVASHSPSNPLLVEEGIFKGQMLVGDMAYGGIQRCFLEKVNGEWQGCVFNWSGGFESGVGAILWGDNGSLIVGGQGMGDMNNWGWLAQKEGLQKIVPRAGAPIVFEPFSMRSRNNGFELAFTKSLNEAAALNTGNYTVRRYEQQSQISYGAGNLADNTGVNVSGISISEDNKSVFFEIDIPGQIYRSGELQLNTGVYIQMGDAITSQDGDDLWVNQVWYSLNSISESEAFDINGCTDDGFEEYNPDATFDDGTCFTPAARIKPFAGTPVSDFRISRTQNGIMVTVDTDRAYLLSVRTTGGSLIETFSGNGKSSFNLKKDKFPGGMYFLTVNTEGQAFSTPAIIY
jgi:hypothetical protein